MWRAQETVALHVRMDDFDHSASVFVEVFDFLKLFEFHVSFLLITVLSFYYELLSMTK